MSLPRWLSPLAQRGRLLAHGVLSIAATGGRRVADGAFVGAITASLLTVVHYVARQRFPDATLPDLMLLNLLGSVPKFTFAPYFIVAHHRQASLVLLLGLLLLSGWSRTRHAAMIGLQSAAGLCAIWVAAMACGVAYALDHRLGLLPGLVALPVAVLFAFWKRLRVGSLLVFATGLAFAMLVAQAFFSFPFQDDFVHLVSPLYGVVPVVSVTLILTVITAFLPRTTPLTEGRVRRGIRVWGLLAACSGSAIAVGVELHGLRPRTAEPPGSRVLDNWAYDVHIAEGSRDLVWTDRKDIHVLTNPYGAQHERYRIDAENSYFAERIWASPTDGFYIASSQKLGWWKSPQPGERVSDLPAVRYPSPDWLRADSSTLWTVVEDPARKRVVTVNEYFSHYAVLDRDRGDMVAHGVIADAVWPWWAFSANLPSRTVYMASALDDGGLYEMNLDSLAVSKKASNLYMHETAVDPERQLLWGAQSLTGDVIAVDTKTYEVRHRVPVEFGMRDLTRDPESGDLYTCSYIFGDIYRVDTRQLTASRIGWCGRFCRNMFIDSKEKMLWVATRDGVCRLPLPGGQAQSHTTSSVGNR